MVALQIYDCSEVNVRNDWRICGGFVKQMLLLTGNPSSCYRLSDNCSPDSLNRETFDTSPNFPQTMSQKSGQIVGLCARWS